MPGFYNVEIAFPSPADHRRFRAHARELGGRIGGPVPEGGGWAVPFAAIGAFRASLQACGGKLVCSLCKAPIDAGRDAPGFVAVHRGCNPGTAGT